MIYIMFPLTLLTAAMPLLYLMNAAEEAPRSRFSWPPRSHFIGAAIYAAWYAFIIVCLINGWGWER